MPAALRVARKILPEFHRYLHSSCTSGKLFSRRNTLFSPQSPLFTGRRMASSIADYLAQSDLAAAESAAKAVQSTAEKSDVAADPAEGVSRVPKQEHRTFKGEYSKKWTNRTSPGMATDLQKKTKKYAILMGYAGEGYNGMQWNPNVDTIESVLFEAMAKAEMIPKDWQANLQQLNFQRCARTDKGVSAAGQVVSVPLPVDSETVKTALEKINSFLPPTIRLFGLRKVTRGFNSKNWCSARTYLYMCPSFVFAPLEDVVTYDYRLPVERVTEVNTLLARYLGSNNFHNFTVGVKPWQDAAKRYMKEVKCSQPFVREGVELVIITVKGQSFMMHQIRKMVGLVIAIMRGHVTAEIFDTIFKAQKADVPRAPGLGLLLQAVHFDMYDQKFSDDGMHEPLVWPECELEIEKFKEDHIYPSMIKGEKEESNMLNWLSHLPNFVFGHREHEERSDKDHQRTELGRAHVRAHEAEQQNSSDEEGGGSDSGETVARPARKKRGAEVF